MNAKLVLECLLKLQSLEFDKAGFDGLTEQESDKKITSLRLQIPLPILNHYDRLGARGKKGVAAVSHQTCTGCHVQVTKAVVMSLMRGEDIQVCENCGRYLYLSEPDPAEMPKAKKAARKLRAQGVELPWAA